MDLLVKLGVLGATPFVVQFLLDELNWKHVLAIVVGAVLAVLLALYQAAIPTDPLAWFFLVLNGGIQGAMATAGVALGFKVAEKFGGTK